MKKKGEAFVSFYSDEHQLTALDLAIAEFRRKSAHLGDMWDNAAKALAHTRGRVKTGGFREQKRVAKSEGQLSREIKSVFAQASRR